MPRKRIQRSTPEEGNVIDLKTQKPVQIHSVPLICMQIKIYREKAGIEQKAMAKVIGVTPNAISNWESGRARPDINLIPGICDVLGVSLYKLFDMEETGEKYSVQEMALVKKYRQLKPSNRVLLDNLASDMLSIQEAEECPALTRLLFYQRSLAAGCGDPTEFDGKALPIYLYAEMLNRSAGSSASRRADCVFPVSGDSMEPDYHSGDLVLVERIPDADNLRQGEIGAFIVGNETYIKEYSENGLVSLNPKYPLLRFDEEDKVYLIGRVLGKLDPACIAGAVDVERYKKIHPVDAENMGATSDGNEVEIVHRELIDRYLR